MNNNYDCVMGNHEELFLEYAPTIKEFENDFNMEYCPYYFERCGGKATLESYISKEIYSKHYKYIQKLPLYLEYKDFKKDDRYLVVSHSAVSKSWVLRNSDNTFEKEEFRSMALWSRFEQYDNKDIFNVYGHTIVNEPKISSFDCNIDLGCYLNKSNEKTANPRICALEFPSMKIYTQESLEE